MSSLTLSLDEPTPDGDRPSISRSSKRLSTLYVTLSFSPHSVVHPFSMCPDLKFLSGSDLSLQTLNSGISTINLDTRTYTKGSLVTSTSSLLRFQTRGSTRCRSSSLHSPGRLLGLFLVDDSVLLSVLFFRKGTPPVCVETVYCEPPCVFLRT